NMNYSRSVLFWYMQPLFFTGLRADYAVSDTLDVKVFAANGWNNSVDNNRGKTVGAQVFVKPADAVALYFGYVVGPEQTDFGITAPTPPATAPAAGNVPDANSHLRHMLDFVADLNPTKELRFLVNADYRTESDLPDPTGTGTHTASVYGGNV